VGFIHAISLIRRDRVEGKPKDGRLFFLLLSWRWVILLLSKIPTTSTGITLQTERGIGR